MLEDVDVRAEVAGGEATACRWRADADAVPGSLLGSDVGAEAVCGVFVAPFETDDVISPAAAETLLVNDEMAQPVHEAASLGCGVLMRGVGVADVSVAGGGRTVSGIVAANFRTRCI